MHTSLQQKELEIRARDAQIQQLSTQLRETDERLQQREAQLQQKDEMIQWKNADISTLQREAQRLQASSLFLHDELNIISNTLIPCRNL